VLGVILIGLAVNAHSSSRWVAPSFLAGLSLVFLLGTTYVLASKLFAESQQLSAINRLFLLGGSTVLPIALALALGGYQINDRITRVGADLETRENHWENVIASARHGFWRTLFGNGVGSYPGRYIDSHPEKVREVGSFNILEERQRNVLRLGGGRDLAIGQRVPIQPYTIYSVNVSLRAEQAGKLGVALCERNLIYASNFQANCVSGSMRFDATDGAFTEQTLELNSGRVGERSALGRWPTVVSLHYDTVGTVLDVESVTLSADGFNVVRNTSFKNGMDYWFHYDDFSHLPWHVKNALLQVWFETGWLGLALFVALLGLLIRTILARHTHDSLAPVYTTAVISLAIFGVFGSPLDSARVSWMFYFFLAAGLASLRVGKGTRADAAAGKRA
jgi:MFS family permease